MVEPSMTREALRLTVERFMDAFNRADLEAAMAFFGDGAVYDEFNGKRHQGKDAIADALAPQFRGDFGTIVFEAEELFVDEASRQVLVSWVCRIDGAKGRAWRGLDVLRFEGGFIAQKSTYAKTKIPLSQPAG